MYISCRSFSGHTAPVNHVRYSPSGHLLASCSSDKTVRLWLPNVNGDSVVLRGHNGPVRCVDFSQSATGTSFGNESFLATCSDDKTIKIWNLPSKSFKCTFLGHTNWVRACQFSKDNWNLCASGSDDNTIRTWDIESAKNISTYPFERACGSNSMNSKRRGTTFSDSVGVRSIDFHPTGASLAAAGANGNINLYDLRSDKLVQTFPFSSDNSKNTRIKFQSGNITFHPSGNYLLCSSVRSSNKAPGYKLWDLRRHQCLYSILPSSENMEDSTAPCAFSSDGSRFCSVGSNASVLVWNTFSLQNDTKVDTNLESPKENIITDIGECKKNNYNHPQQEYVVEDVATNTLEEVNPFDKSTVRSSNHQQYVGKNEINQNVLVGALEHIVGQLDMLTKTIGLLDKRLAIIEDCHKKKVDQIPRTSTS